MGHSWWSFRRVAFFSSILAVSGVGVAGAQTLTNISVAAPAIKGGAGFDMVQVANGAGPVSTMPAPRPLNSVGRSVPPGFVENKGQWDRQVRFQLQNGNKSLWVTSHGIVFDNLRGVASETVTSGASETSTPPVPPGHAPIAGDRKYSERIVFAEDFVGASNSRIEGISQRPGAHNYLVGNDRSNWYTGARGYDGVILRDLWPGVDLQVFAKGLDLEQEFIIHPGADSSRIHVSYRGIDKIAVSADGSLVIHTPAGQLRELRPTVYQEINGRRAFVGARWKLIDSRSYSFEVDSFDPTAALVIDPTLLYSTFLGGGAGFGCGAGGCGTGESATSIAVDASGNAFVTGFTQSSDFPVTPGAFQTMNDRQSVFVTKLSPLGDSLVYSTYLGVDSSSSGIALDAAGNAYITGAANSSGFPTTPTAYQTNCTAAGTAFVTKLNAVGDGLTYSTCFGYAATSTGIAVDSSGRAYVVGYTGYGVPTTPGALQPTRPPANRTTFFFVLDPSAAGDASLVYSTYIGGSVEELGLGIAVDGIGMAYVTGNTYSPNFPITPGAYQPTIAGSADAFIAKFNPSASGSASLLYATYLGGPGYDSGNAIAADTFGDIHIAGTTDSGLHGGTFPVTPGAVQPTYSTGDYNGFVTKLSAAGNELIYSTYMGGVMRSASLRTPRAIHM